MPRGVSKSQSAEKDSLLESSSEVESKVENVVTAQANVSGGSDMNKGGLSMEEVLSLLIKLQSKVETLEQEKKELKNDKFSYDGDFNSIKINQDDYIKVVSLCPNELNLSTERGGKGKMFTFRSFGSSKRILYSDLVDIMENYPHFRDDGLFWIADQRVIRRHGLDDTYANILNEEMINKVLDGATDQDTISLVKSVPKRQQETIAQMLIDRRVVDPDSIDLNFWDKFERATDIPLQEKYESTKEYLDALNMKNE